MIRRFNICVIAAMLALGFSPGCSSTRSVSVMPMASLVPARIDLFGGFARGATREWNEWADSHLQNGDIVFMRGDCHMLMGTVNFSEFSTDLTASRFSHIGLVAIEDDQVYVYDIRNKGCMRTRFGELLADGHVHQLAVKRYRGASTDNLAATAKFCRTAFKKREKFDDHFKLDNGRLYCAELVEEAYRSEGFRLSEPVAIQDLPNYERHLKAVQLVRAITSIEPDQPVLLPGNEQIGIWANPSLDLILDLPDTKLRPLTAGLTD